MILLFVLFGVFGACVLAGRFGVRVFKSWVTCLRCGLAALFLLTASAHWNYLRPDLVRMVPPAFSNPELLVTLSGVAEIAGAVGLLIPRVAPWAACGLALLLVAVFPANVHAAEVGIPIGGATATPLVPRILMQVVFLLAVLVAGFAQRWSRPHALDSRRTGNGSESSTRKS